MRTTYILDTSTLIHDPTAWKNFPYSDIIIPNAVLTELDKLKKQAGEVGRNARVSIRLLDDISNFGDISSGVLLDDDILIKADAQYIDTTQLPYIGMGDPHYGDTQILACAYHTHLNHPTHDVILISSDINLRTKAKFRGIKSVALQNKQNITSELYCGMQIITNEELGMELQRTGHIDPEDHGLNLNPHECVLFQGDNGDGIAMGRKVAQNRIKVIKKHYPWNIRSRNKEQAMAIDLIMDPAIDLVTLIGRAGSGKSLVALAASLEMVISKREYDRLIIYRPIQVVGNDIGYVPGTIQEKLAPHFTAIMDNFEVLFSGKVGSDWKRDLEMFQKKGRIELEAIAYIRGRSIPNAIMLIDEAQNLSKEEIKTILTRAGEGTKIILTGDIDQIDARDLDAANNGLTHTIEKFKSSELAGHITLTQGERSRLATLASEIL
jgi:PhoH-like ATPase